MKFFKNTLGVLLALGLAGVVLVALPIACVMLIPTAQVIRDGQRERAAATAHEPEGGQP